MKVIDLRSDTVTRPDAAMRRAMAEAEVGDDDYGEDPTARRLEEESAAAAGCETGLFVPSGTMGNQIALHLHARRGTQVLCEERCHLVDYEKASMAALSGLRPRPVRSRDGLPEPRAVEDAVTPIVDGARVGLLALENTHMASGGRPFGRARLEPLLAIARRHGLPVHLDGARIFNAAVALDVTVPELVRGFDSVMFCLSKGLGAPVGSLLCGSAAFVAAARAVRKLFGGGMRQIGGLAAAGLLALRHGPSGLAEDHANAQSLAARLVGLPGVSIDPQSVQTNIVVFRAAGGSVRWLERASRAGVAGVKLDAERVRFVTHRDVSRAEIAEAARRLTAAFG